ncbi:hypothetical protein [Mycolicibacterium madagascariense]|uniref:hypothetical protein n=1 Tax=Mycolicibacterium madagascariense TaxID=212765 RepID=UPI0013D57834|nr:hypothetical protein [Mycolicibacterium madagascariense]MCV7013380.1 hypothetical protein [Mycolicibacterium madagascariense]
MKLLRDPVTIALVAGGLVVFGILAMNWPVQLGDYDRWGFRIGCGTGFASSYDQATLADQQPPTPPQPQGGYADRCESAVVWRRTWASTVIVLGGGALVLLLGRDRRPVEADRIVDE